MERAADAKRFGEKFLNPFDAGTLRGNFEQVLAVWSCAAFAAWCSLVTLCYFFLLYLVEIKTLFKVYGSDRHPLLAILPSFRRPQKPCIPIFLEDTEHLLGKAYLVV